MQTRYYLGIMTGTSLDGIDVALISEESGRYHYRAHHEQPMPPELRVALQALCRPGQNELHRAAIAAWQHAEASAAAVAILLQKTGLAARNITALGAHGQTLRHSPDHTPPYTIQLQNPALIAERTGIDTIADFRSRDLAAGGQGAPLAPLFQRGLLGAHPATLVNIGGIANISFISAEACSGYDTGPGNGLMDSWMQHHHGQPYDADGNWARRGKLLPGLLARLLADRYFHRAPPKSSGRDHFHLDWLTRRLRGDERPADVQRTLLELTAYTIAQAIRAARHDGSIYLAGGGAKNRYLVERLDALLGKTCEPCPIPAQALEASGFAWLAAQFTQRRPLDLNATTGGKPRILGALYPA
ncbi:MAG: anhydro-N-acetylmuramic acid kinase [Cardiobacterium sp.]|nr:MAG: anhydro-N-acetylmuramic acid kinase [Cardiobacterium sp.]